MLPHALRTGRGKLHIVLPGAAGVGVTLDADRHRGPRFQHVADLVEQRVAARLDGRLVEVEEDLLFQLDLLGRDLDQLVLLRAAVVVRRSRIVRALVGRVGDTVLVVVGIGATVVVLEAVLVLGIVRALVLDVRNAVGVVVRIRATVQILEAVPVFRLVRALVGLVRDAVLVVVQIGTTVFVLEAVLVLGIVGALVDVVEDAVVVAVAGRPRGAAQGQVVRLAGVAIGDPNVVAGAEVIALIQFVHREFDVGLGQRQLVGGALVRAAVARLLGDGADLAHVRLQLQARAPAHHDRQQARRRERPHARGRPRAHSGSDRFGAGAGSSCSLAGVVRVDRLAASACLLTAIARARFARSSAFLPYSMASWYSEYPASSRALCRYSSAAVYS